MTPAFHGLPRATLLCCGAFSATVGLVLLGWGPLTMAAALLLNGLALLAIATGHPRVSLAGALGSLLAGGLRLAGLLPATILSVNLGRMSPGAAACFVVCGAAMLWMSIPRLRGMASAAIGVMGAVVLAFGSAALATVSGMGLAASGAGVLTLAWQFSGDDSSFPRWLAVAAGCGGVTLSVCSGLAPATVILVGILLAMVGQLAFVGRRRAAALRSSYAELAVIHANAPVALLVVDGQLRVEKVNALAARLAGHPQSDLIGLGTGEAIGCLNSLADPRGCGHGPSCGQCAIRLATLDTLRNGVGHGGVEAWMPGSADGLIPPRGLLISTAAIQFDHTKKVLISAQDITARKRAELELQRQAELIDLSHDAIIETDSGRVIRRWNTGAEEIYGWSASEASGRTLHSLLQTKGTLPEHDILHRNGRWEGELVHTGRDGHVVITESRQVLVRDATGAPGGILEINRDVTQRKRAQAELAEAHRRNTVILESISDGFNSLDRDWRYTYVNPAAARLVHKKTEELLGKNLWELWPHTAASPFGVAYRRAVAENVVVQVEAFYPEPLNAWFEVRCYPSPEGLTLFFTDTTERKRAEEQLRQTVRALESALAEKTVLLKEVHHRVKNNLAVIAGLLQMRACASKDTAVREALEDSRQRVYSIALIHEHLYGSDRLDRIDFAEYARQLVEQLYAALIRVPGRISFTFASDPVQLAIHRAVPCALILNELLSNVFKHAFPGERTGKISVVFRESGAGFVELTVEDDGVGLPDGWETSKSLGWQIIRILARQLDGTLAAEPSAGTRFVLRFPVRQ